ncbi:MAG TPA: alpha/beta fold hydrolase [Rhizomicrobium sp.]|jgi:hypothetical protein
MKLDLSPLSAAKRNLTASVILLGAAAVLASQAHASLDKALKCRLGSYALSDGRTATIVGFDGTSHDLAYVLSSGEYGRLAWQPGNSYALGNGPLYGTADFSDCASGTVTLVEAGRPTVRGTHTPFRVTETFFDSAGTRLHGKLVLPASGKADSVVVWIQGSDDDPATDDEYWQYVLPLRSIGVFVYDKRGSGQSGGELSADFAVRAADTAAASREVRRLVPAARQVGVFGGSQGGWVAPLTATKARLDFVIVGYGLAEGVTAQDRDEVEDQVRQAGYGDDAIRKVREITAATATIVRSHWMRGWSKFAAIRRKYIREPWIGAIKDTGYTGQLLRAPIAQARLMGPRLDKHVSFNYDPRPVIARIAPAQLWVLGGADHTAPNARTVQILERIQKRKSNLDLVIYNEADHGISESFTQNGIVRHRHPDSLSDLIARWIVARSLPAPDADLKILRGLGARGD